MITLFCKPWFLLSLHSSRCLSPSKYVCIVQYVMSFSDETYFYGICPFIAPQWLIYTYRTNRKCKKCWFKFNRVSNLSCRNPIVQKLDEGEVSMRCTFHIPVHILPGLTDPFCIAQMTNVFSTPTCSIRKSPEFLLVRPIPPKFHTLEA